MKNLLKLFSITTLLHMQTFAVVPQFSCSDKKDDKNFVTLEDTRSMPHIYYKGFLLEPNNCHNPRSTFKPEFGPIKSQVSWNSPCLNSGMRNYGYLDSNYKNNPDFYVQQRQLEDRIGYNSQYTLEMNFETHMGLLKIVNSQGHEIINMKLNCSK